MDESDVMDGAPVKDIPTLVALVETPLWGDTKFFGRWLIAVAEAQEAVEAAHAADPDLQERDAWHEPISLHIAAMVYIHDLTGSLDKFTKPDNPELYADYVIGSHNSFVVDIDGDFGNEFFVLAEMGFFVLTGTRYQMVMPKSITPEGAAAAIERLLSTEDEDGILHHEYIIKCMPRFEAEQWQRRLFSSDGARLVDRPLGAGRSCIRLNLHNSAALRRGI